MTRKNRTRLHRPVIAYAQRKVATLQQDMRIEQALEAIRQKELEDEIIYFYVVDDQERLVGVLPTRRLLGAALDQRISDVMIREIITIPEKATVLDAHKYFVRHKFLAFPITDADQRILGVVNVGMFTDHALDLADQKSMDRTFEMLGFRLLQVREAAPLRAFRFRIPWLLATIASGTACALLAGVFEATLSQSLVLAFFLTLVLGLGESVSTQSMTVTIQALRARHPTLTWYLKVLWREVRTALLMGLACGAIVGLIVWLWQGDSRAAAAIGVSLSLAICSAVFFGLSIPTLLHRMKFDLKIAAGPVTLAVTDISTILIYFSISAAVL